MLKKPKSKQKTVAEKVAELIAQPNHHDSNSDSEIEATAPRVIDFDEDEYQIPDAGTTEFRKRNVKLLSEQSSKYKGKLASRKDFEEENSDEQEEDSEDDEEYEQSDEEEDQIENEPEYNDDSDENEKSFKAFSKILSETRNGTFESMESGSDDEKSSNKEDCSDTNVDSKDDEDGNSSCDDDDDLDDDSFEEDNDEDDDDNNETEVISQVNHEAEIQKGTSVQNQLRLWERLLELRINTQKFLTKANQLPASNELKEMQTLDEKHKAVLGETCRQTQNLLGNLVSLQNTLYSQFPEINQTMKKCLKRPLPFKDNQSGEPLLKQMNVFLQNRFETFTPYRNEVLLKWDDRTRLLTPGAGAKKKPMDEDYDIVKKINNVLLNKSMLIKKSQQSKNVKDVEKEMDDVDNQEETNAENCNIYDDSDFYHQQLRELIEYKANSSSNMSEVTKQFLELQKLRQKMKKKVDTRASKGRKLRYLVHNKLINFMAPQDNSTWTDESKEELCKSLFV